jgi:hypothetical protein
MLEYVGSGDFINGVPARDLTDDDLIEALERYGWSQEQLIATGLYVPAQGEV